MASLVCSAVARPAGSWSRQLWGLMEPVYRAVLEHPFLVGLVDGSLASGAFGRFVAQDVHYLRVYARVLAVVGAKAPEPADAALFVRRAGAVADELALHAALVVESGLDVAAVAAVPVAPTTCAYTSYLLAVAYGGSFAEGLAAVLPCYWMYAKVAAALAEDGSPDHRYQRWIDSYAAEEFAMVVEEVLAVVDRVGSGLGPAERERAAGHSVATARYEWMFWDAAYRGERWPL